jgi:hypothetical protein
MSTFQLTACLSWSFLLVLRAWEDEFLGMDDVFFGGLLFTIVEMRFVSQS